MNLKTSAYLSLADGNRWNIICTDESGCRFVSQLCELMRLQPCLTSAKQLHVWIDNHQTCFYNGKSTIFCNSSDYSDEYIQLIRFSIFVAMQVQRRGGFFVHGAFAEFDGNGVILCGPGGSGKTTASFRLPHPWKSLCDDTTLIVRDEQGIYRAHPWPTWSRLMSGSTDCTWDVQYSTQLKKILFLSPAKPDQEDQVSPALTEETICLLVTSAEQAWINIPGDFEKKNILSLRLERFDNICALAKKISCYHLRLTLDGEFWKKIESLLNIPAPA